MFNMFKSKFIESVQFIVNIISVDEQFNNVDTNSRHSSIFNDTNYYNSKRLRGIK
jgi:hypothetical protein